MNDHLSVIKLATRWGFSELRSRSIEAATIRFRYPIDLITWGKRYMVPQWPIEGYKRIIKGTYPSIEVASKLGSKPFYHLMAVRDQYLQTPASSSKGPLHRKGSTSSLKFDFDARIVALIDAGHLEGALSPDCPVACESSTDSDTMVDGNGERGFDISVCWYLLVCTGKDGANETAEVVASAAEMANMKSTPLKSSQLYCIKTVTFLVRRIMSGQLLVHGSRGF